jgi:hypothetical protein
MSERAPSPNHPSARRGGVLWPCGAVTALTCAFLVFGCKPGAKGSDSATPAGPPLSVKDQCAQLVQTVQTGRTKFDSTQDSADFEKDTRQSALLLQELRDDIGKSNVTDSGLKKIATDYQASLGLASSDLTAMATASKSSDDRKVDTLSKQFDSHWRATSAIDTKLTAYCANK